MGWPSDTTPFSSDSLPCTQTTQAVLLRGLLRSAGKTIAREKSFLETSRRTASLEKRAMAEQALGSPMAADPTAISRPKPADFIPGYRLEKLVGKGGMGEVHQAVQLSLGRTVAVKLLSAELASDDSFVARFEKEGAALAALRHPSIVS